MSAARYKKLGASVLVKSELFGRDDRDEEERSKYVVGFDREGAEYSAVPENISTRILSEKDLTVLTGWLKLAAKAETLENFVKGM